MLSVFLQQQRSQVDRQYLNPKWKQNSSWIIDPSIAPQIRVVFTWSEQASQVVVLVVVFIVGVGIVLEEVVVEVVGAVVVVVDVVVEVVVVVVVV